MAEADLTLFRHVAVRPEGELDLGLAALVLAEPEYPGLDMSRWLGELDALGAEARAYLDSPERAGVPPLVRVARLLHDHLGFCGNAQEYYDPRNSFLNEVLARRTGIPITLAVILLEVGRRVGAPGAGVAFPRHFLVRTPVRDGFALIDPFSGRTLDREALRALYGTATGEGPGDPPPQLLEPASKRQIVARMLGNLRAIYTMRGDRPRLRSVLERLAELTPSDELDAELARVKGPPPAPAGRN